MTARQDSLQPTGSNQRGESRAARKLAERLLFRPARSINTPVGGFRLRDLHVRSRQQFRSSGQALRIVAARSFLLPQMGIAAQLGAPPDLEPQVAASQGRYYFACGSKPVSFKR